MIELKINENEASVVVEQGDNFLTECTMAVHALAGAISEAEGVSQSVQNNRTELWRMYGSNEP